MTIERSMITGLILAGGRATRMGGVDKGLQPLNGEAMVAHVLRGLQPQVGAMMINANRNQDAYRKFGAPVLPDLVTGYAGPLAGLHAGLAQCRTPWLVTAPCDSPLLPDDLVMRLAAALQRDDSDVAVAATGDESARQRHPVFMLVKTSLLPQLSVWLDAGGRKVDDWLRSLKCAEAPFDNEALFENVNTNEQLDQISQRLR